MFRTRMSRIDFIKVLLRGSMLALVSMTALPVLRFLIPPKSRHPMDKSLTVAKLSELPLNSAKIFPFRGKPAIVIHTPSDEFKAFSAVCTHLNCTVAYDSTRNSIHCACHNGLFGLDGQVISGPPPKPLEQYSVIIQKGDVIVSKG